MEYKFKSGDNVRFVQTNDIELDKRYGTVNGVASTHPMCTFYIVSLNPPMSLEGFGDMHQLTITEYCLEPL